MRFSRLTDYDLIRETMTHPRLYKWLCKEVSSEQFSPPGRMLYVAVHDGPEYLGLFALDPVGSDTWEIHTCLLPNAWGKRAAQAYTEGIEWVWNNTARGRIVGRIRDTNRLALRIARGAGLCQFNSADVSETDGKTYHILELEICKHG